MAHPDGLAFITRTLGVDIAPRTLDAAATTLPAGAVTAITVRHRFLARNERKMRFAFIHVFALLTSTGKAYLLARPACFPTYCR
jgi:hypothetical protein